MNKWIKSLLVFFIYYLNTSGFYLLPVYLQGYNASIFNKYTLILYLFIADVLFMSILGIIYNKDIINGFKKISLKKIEFAIGPWLFGMVIMGLSNLLISRFSPVAIAANEEGVKQSLQLLPVYMTFSTIIYAPFVEELVFRQALRDIIKNNSLFIIVAGLLFGLVHVIDSYNSFYDLLFVIPYGVMGVCFAYMYCKTESIATSMIIHCIHNSLLVILFFIH